jgi:hypothetical protein
MLREQDPEEKHTESWSAEVAAFAHALGDRVETVITKSGAVHENEAMQIWSDIIG